MGRDLEKLFQLTKEKYRIKEIHIQFNKTKEPKLTATATLERNRKVETISSSEEDFLAYVSHLHSIPHIEDDEGDFVYIDNPNKFFEIQEKVVDIFSGKRKELVICERNIDKKNRSFSKRIRDYEREWILSKKTCEFFAPKFAEFFMT